MSAPILPRWEDAQGRIHELLAELVDIIGPTCGGEASLGPGEGPVGTLTLWDYVVVGCWVDDDRQDWVSIVPAAGMLSHHVTGLLRDAERQYCDYGGDGEAGP